MVLNADIQPVPRTYIPSTFNLTSWESVKAFFDELMNRPIPSKLELETWLKDVNEVQAVVSEEACWKQIKMTCDTENKALEEDFTNYCMHIEPAMKPYFDSFNRKLVQSHYVSELTSEGYSIYLRNVRKEIDLFREENIPIQAELNVLAQQYGNITGSMSITHEDKEYTLQQAAKFLQESNRTLREEVYMKINARRKQSETELNTLFDTLLEKRHQVALNAGFENYRDYKFKEYGRFDYGVPECEQFHEAIRTHITPLVEGIYEHKKNTLGLTELKPYDIDAEPEGRKPLEPFKNGEELLTKSIAAFSNLHPYFGACLEKMKGLQHFDLESRKGKAPGGYNCPLAETGAPFIFMNAAGTADDVVTMMHEGGHALHSFLSHELPLHAFKEYPMEMAELASMSMELFSMDQWHLFYSNEGELNRAKMEELERALSIFPWIATIDKFQHWLYTHPGHTVAEREQAWVETYTEFAPKNISWDGLESYRSMLWQKQLHLFEVPFYYIEYGIAQLGALAMWKQFRKDKMAALDNYIRALHKGNSLNLPQLYATAGIAFDFSSGRVKELSEFVRVELEVLLGSKN